MAEAVGPAELQVLQPRDAGGWRRSWSYAWPKLTAVGIVVAVWQALYWLHWKPDYVLPAPATVLGELGRELGTAKFYQAAAVTLTRAGVGYAIAVVIGCALGMAMAGIRPLRSAVGSLITGL